MQQINIRGMLLNEEQISNLINNAEELKIENKVLRQELQAIKEESQ